MELKFNKTIFGYNVSFNLGIKKKVVEKKINTDYDFIALDTESINGRGGIVSIGLAYFKDNKVVKTFYSLVCPENALEFEQASSICGIHYSDVEREKHFPEVWESIEDDVCNYPLVGHSIGNDISQLKRIAKQCNIEFKLRCIAKDTHSLASKLLNLKKYSLADVSKALRVSHLNTHNSLEDAICAGKVYLELEKLPEPEVRKNSISSEIINRRKTASSKFNTHGIYFSPENRKDSDSEWYGKRCFVIGNFSEFTQDYLKEKLYSLGVNICKALKVDETDIIIYGQTSTTKKINKAAKRNLIILNEKEIKEKLGI